MMLLKYMSYSFFSKGKATSFGLRPHFIRFIFAALNATSRSIDWLARPIARARYRVLLAQPPTTRTLHRIVSAGRDDSPWRHTWPVKLLLLFVRRRVRIVIDILIISAIGRRRMIFSEGWGRGMSVQWRRAWNHHRQGPVRLHLCVGWKWFTLHPLHLRGSR